MILNYFMLTNNGKGDNNMNVLTWKKKVYETESE